MGTARRGVRAGLRSATGNRVPGESWVAGSNPALSAQPFCPSRNRPPSTFQAGNERRRMRHECDTFSAHPTRRSECPEGRLGSARRARYGRQGRAVAVSAAAFGSLARPAPAFRLVEARAPVEVLRGFDSRRLQRLQLARARIRRPSPGSNALPSQQCPYTCEEESNKEDHVPRRRGPRTAHGHPEDDRDENPRNSV
jgi:hypothetical protein